MIPISRIIFLTGPPRVGKTTIVIQVAERLRRLGYKVGGMISQEIREHGRRVGFKVVDLGKGREGVLAHINQSHGPRVSKYRVNLRDLEEIGVKAIERALDEDDVVIIDEVGKMELFSRKFVEVVERALRSGKPVLGTVHLRSFHPLARKIREGRVPNSKVIVVSLKNRERLAEEIFKELLSSLKRQ